MSVKVSPLLEFVMGALKVKNTVFANFDVEYLIIYRK
jgi:hypothetical protein